MQLVPTTPGSTSTRHGQGNVHHTNEPQMRVQAQPGRYGGAVYAIAPVTSSPASASRCSPTPVGVQCDGSPNHEGTKTGDDLARPLINCRI